VNIEFKSSVRYIYISKVNCVYSEFKDEYCCLTGGAYIDVNDFRRRCVLLS
jgi:hypothetical protein